MRPNISYLKTFKFLFDVCFIVRIQNVASKGWTYYYCGMWITLRFKFEAECVHSYIDGVVTFTMEVVFSHHYIYFNGRKVTVCRLKDAFGLYFLYFNTFSKYALVLYICSSWKNWHICLTTRNVLILSHIRLKLFL